MPLNKGKWFYNAVTMESRNHFLNKQGESEKP